MNPIESLKARLDAALVAGEDTSALRAEIAQLEAADLSARALAARDAAANKNAEIFQTNALAAELAEAALAGAALSNEPIEEVTMNTDTDIPADLKGLVETHARIFANAEIQVEKASTDDTAEKTKRQGLADRYMQALADIEGLRTLGASRSLTDAEGGRLILLQMDLQDLAGPRAAADRAVDDAIARLALKNAELKKARADYESVKTQARLALRHLRARRLEEVFVTALAELWAETKAANPRASWTSTWLPGAELKRVTVLNQAPTGSME